MHSLLVGTRLAALALGVAGLLAVVGSAQAQGVGDYPAYKGSSARTGRNGAPGTNGSGSTSLRWYLPAGANANAPIVSDNALNQTATGVGNSRTGAWIAPTVDQEAPFPYLIRDPADANSIYRPAYEYAITTPSATGNDPTQAVDNANRRIFEWTVTPPTGQRFFGVYVWLPNGPTVRPSGTLLYPQRYYVYEVLLGTRRVLVDVVDTYGAGNGWVRLGNGGAPTNFVVPGDGADPIVVRLYNTVPRDANGDLLVANSPTSYAVYADAVQAVATTGWYAATPTVMTFRKRDLTSTRRVVAPLNTPTVTYDSNGIAKTVERAVVSSILFNGLNATPPPYNQVFTYWRYTPVGPSGNTTTIDNSPGATVNGTAFQISTTGGAYTGANYHVATANATAITSTVSYTPTLAEGDYELFAYVSGNNSGLEFCRYTRYEVVEGSTVNSVVLDQRTPGWKKIGLRKYRHTEAAPLAVRVADYTPVATEAGKLIMADAIRFIGDADLTVTSTPVQGTARIKKSDGTIAETPVVIVADERGVLHCLDAEGNNDGTTTEYWSYPSAPQSDDPNWRDPNVVENLDGVNKPGEPTVVTAAMPTGFDTSSALIQRIDGEDYLFIASRNGRVYAIAMQGRGDYNRSQSGGGTIVHPGTTQRYWTYPNDPLDDPAKGVATSTLGSFVGSLGFVQTSAGPTIVVPAPQGRVYALDARASTSKPRTTTVRWAYPTMNNPTLGPIVSTPAIEFGQIFVGTLRKDDDPGRFLALNAADGTVAWQYGSTPPGGTVELSDFRCSPITVPGTILGETNNTVFALNDNGYLYSLRANDGALQWMNNEQVLSSRTTLGFTFVTSVVNNLTQSVPVVTISTANGRFYAYLARTTQTTLFGSRRVMTKYTRNGEELTAPSFANGWLYFGDRGGYLYAFADSTAAGSQVDTNDVPVDEDLGDEDPNAAFYRKVKVKMITRDAYRRLQGLAGVTRLTYAEATSAANALNRDPAAFEWGETVYLLIYDFPYSDLDGNVPTIPPTFNLDVTVDGKVTRSIPATGLKFEIVGNNNPPRYSQALPASAPPEEGDPRLDGYGVVQFSYQSGGQNAMPPGPGRFQLSMTATPPNAQANRRISLPGGVGLDFYIANPLALVVGNTVGEAIGMSLLPQDPENRVNGSPAIPGSTAQKNLLGTSTGMVTHGQSGSTTVQVVDRSLMALLRPSAEGSLDNVRVQMRDLGWQGGEGAIFKPLDDTLYPGYEDKPTSFPNVSLDYPNMGRERIRATKDPNGKPENPANFRTTLFAPYVMSGGSRVDVTQANAASRVLNPTPFVFDVDVPKYQPANTADRLRALGLDVKNSVGTTLPQGYLGRISVFVDSLENGLLDTVQMKEAYRSFNLFASVAPDERLAIGTASIDLGSLAAGTGYSPLWPAAGGPYDPWGGAWSGAYKPFVVRNEGNMNLLNLRLAKGYQAASGGAYLPWAIPSDTNDGLAWLDGSTDLYSDLNAPFAPVNANAGGPTDPRQTAVILPKPRVQDRVGTELSVNPVRRANPILGTTGTTSTGLPDALHNPTAYPPGPPRIGVSVPIGFPVGKYDQLVRVVEGFRFSAGTYDTSNAWSIYPEGPLPASDPGLNLGFTVRETRVTNTPTPRTAPMVESLAQTPSQIAAQQQAFPYSNVQPAALRDASGTLLMAWTSNRPRYFPVPQVPNLPFDADDWKIYFAAVPNAATFGANGINSPVGLGPLRDLNAFSPFTAGNRWFTPVGPSAGFPNVAPDTLFGGSVIDGTVKFGSPVFPNTGVENPYTNATPTMELGNATWMAFVGDAQRMVGGQRVNDSRVFLSRVSLGGGTSIGLGNPVALTSDPTTAKGRPSVVPLPNGGALVFYAGTSGGQTGLYFAPFNGAFGNAVPIDLGRGFESASSPSAVARRHVGVGPLAGSPLVELTFAGKLRNRPNAEVFFGRMTVPASGPVSADPFVFLPAQVEERLTPAGGSSYRSRGVAWDRSVGLRLIQVVGGSAQNLLRDGTDLAGNYAPTATNPDTRVYDRESGMIVYDTRLGGKVYIDPDLGTVRFSAANVPNNAELRLTYQPKFLRVSAESGGSGFASPTVLFDWRKVGSRPFWRRADGSVAQPGDVIHADRLILTYNRAAAGANQAARPLINTMRFGVKLPSDMYVTPAGAVNVTVAGVSRATSFYEIDPVARRIYFTGYDEGNSVNIAYQSLDKTTNGPGPMVNLSGQPVGFVQETDQQEIPIEQAANEANLTAFLDPFTASTITEVRPGLIWMFWSSTRGGVPDVFFQTIAPRFAPIPVQR